MLKSKKDKVMEALTIFFLVIFGGLYIHTSYRFNALSDEYNDLIEETEVCMVLMDDIFEDNENYSRVGYKISFSDNVPREDLNFSFPNWNESITW